MKVKYLLSSSLLLLSSLLLAQDNLVIRKLNATKAISLQMPVMMDSTNVKDKKFEAKELLAINIELPKQSDFKNMVDGVSDVVMLDKTQSDYQIQFLSFQLISDKYTKNTIKINSPNLLELYVDGKKEGSKLTTEKEIKSAKELKKEITTYPFQSQQVVIKLLSTKENNTDEGIKIEVLAADKTVNLSVAYNGMRNTNLLDDLKGVRATAVRTSANGNYALATYRSVEDDGKVINFTQLINTKTKTKSYSGTEKLTWMPKSNLYYCTRKLGDHLQLVSINPDTKQESIISNNIPSGDFMFSPDETFLLYFDKEKNDDRKGDFKLLLAPDDRLPNYLDRTFLSKYDLKTGIKQTLTFGKASTYINDISEDSRYLLFSLSNETITERPFRTTSVYSLDLQTMHVDTIFQNEKFITRVYFSPDMKQLLVRGGPEAFNSVGLNINEGQIANSFDEQIFLVDRASKNITAVSKDFNPSISSANWNAADNLIYLNVIDKDCENVYTYDPTSKKYNKLDLPEDVISSFSISKNNNIASYIGRSISNPSRVYSIDLKSKKTLLLDDPAKEILANVKLGEVKDWNFTASDGTTIEGFYHLPPNFDSSKKHPLIVYYYAGTTPTSRTFEHPYSMHNFASLGYVVYTINPSGAVGYGQEFSARHVNAWGKRTAEDIIEGTQEFLKQHSFVDDKKIGCLGASYGGFMTLYLQTQTDLFAAAISHAGISTLSSYWGEGYWGYTYSSGASANSYPWNNKELYIEQSPLFLAEKIKTPILFTHGTVDTNVPIGESMQMYTALKILGVPTELLQVSGENHGIMKHDRRIEWSHHMYAWFDKWLKDQPEWWNSLSKK